MTNTKAIRWARPQTVADLYDVSVRFLEQRRYRGDGPPFVKAGGAVLYDLNKFDTWLAERERTSTSDAA